MASLRMGPPWGVLLGKKPAVLDAGLDAIDVYMGWPGSGWLHVCAELSYWPVWSGNS